jgi:hypothetical protein
VVPWVFSFDSKNRIYTARVGTLTARIESNIQRETWAKKRCYFKEKTKHQQTSQVEKNIGKHTHTNPLPLWQ